jgi:hypothetical protein
MGSIGFQAEVSPTEPAGAAPPISNPNYIRYSSNDSLNYHNNNSYSNNNTVYKNYETPSDNNYSNSGRCKTSGYVSFDDNKYYSNPIFRSSGYATGHSKFVNFVPNNPQVQPYGPITPTYTPVAKEVYYSKVGLLSLRTAVEEVKKKN